jgi:hypothetical protein
MLEIRWTPGRCLAFPIPQALGNAERPRPGSARSGRAREPLLETCWPKRWVSRVPLSVGHIYVEIVHESTRLVLRPGAVTPSTDRGEAASALNADPVLAQVAVAVQCTSDGASGVSPAEVG